MALSRGARVYGGFLALTSVLFVLSWLFPQYLTALVDLGLYLVRIDLLVIAVNVAVIGIVALFAVVLAGRVVWGLGEWLRSSFK